MAEMEKEEIRIRPIRVVFFHRKPRGLNFSVETLFEEIRSHLPEEIKPIVSIAKYESNGLWKRIYITMEGALRQKWGDVNHVTGDVNFIGLLFRKRRTVLTILDLGFMNHPNPIARKVLKLFWATLPVKRAKIVTTISQATKDELLKHVACDPDKVKVVYVPVSTKFVRRPEKAFNKACPVLLQIGTKPNKNVGRLVDAIKGLNCRLDIVGELSDEVQRKLQEYKIQYTSSSRISEGELLAKYHNCDIVTFMSTYEGFGMPIIEANIIGRPVITSNILSMPEVAAGAAHLVDPFDIHDMRNGIIRVIEDDEYREALVKQGFENHKRFTPDLIASKLAEIYSQLA